MMRKQSSRAVFIWLTTAVGLIALLILPGLLSPQARQTVHAQPAPREILVNALCNNQDTHEHIRFGLESSHYYNFWAKRGLRYQISTRIYATNNEGIAVDTKLILYRHSPLDHPGQPILAENDDAIPTPTPKPPPQSNPTLPPQPQDMYQSLIEYVIPEDGYYWIEVQNMRAGGEGSYCLQITFLEHQVNRADICEPNDSIHHACEIQLEGIVIGKEPDPNANNPHPQPPNQPQNNIFFNFAPLFGHGPDQDFYKLWVRTGETYTCYTHKLSQGNDTFMTFYDHHGVELLSDDNGRAAEIGTNITTTNVADLRASMITWPITYDGWLYIRVRPVVEVDYQYAHHYTYQLRCEYASGKGPTNGVIVADNANPPTNNQGAITSGAPLPDAEEAVAAVEETPAAPAPAVGPVSFVALPQPAATPQPIAAGRAISFTVQIYHDKNDNQIKDPDEGIVNLPVYIYGGAAPLQTVTGMGGGLFVGLETSQNRVRLVIPYLGVNQEIPVANAQDIRIRIAP